MSIARSGGLHQLFERLSPGVMADFLEAFEIQPPKGPTSTLAERADNSAGAADDDKREAMRRVADRILLLSRKDNAHILIREAREQKIELPQVDGPHDRAASAWRHQNDLFEEAYGWALLSKKFERDAHWTGYQCAKEFDADLIDVKDADFVDRLKAIYREYDGSGQTLKLRKFARRSLRGEKDAWQVDILRQGLAEEIISLTDAGKTRRKPIKPQLEASVFLEGQSGVVDVMAERSGKAIRDSIARAFMAKLGLPEAQLKRLPPRWVYLDKLRTRPTSFKYDASDGIGDFRIVQLQLAKPDGSLLTIDSRESSEPDVYASWQHWTYQPIPSFGNCDVSSARIAFDFLSYPTHGKSENRTLRLFGDHGLTAKNWPDELRQRAERLCERWKLISRTPMDREDERTSL
jgi:hypothetical protein